MKYKCPTCKLEGNYKGKKIYVEEYNQYTSCSRCKTSIQIQKIKKEVQDENGTRQSI